MSGSVKEVVSEVEIPEEEGGFILGEFGKERFHVGRPKRSALLCVSREVAAYNRDAHVFPKYGDA
jgi:hypothetical protein